MYTLLVIDMQPYFRTSELALPEVLHLITKAKKDEANILVVNYKGCGRSHNSITRELGNYSNQYTMIKQDDDGGIGVWRTLNKLNWKNVNIVTCGVNSDACINYTIHSLLDCIKNSKIVSKKPKIFVVKKACNCNKYRAGREWNYYNSDIKMINDKDIFSVKFDVKEAMKSVKNKKMDLNERELSFTVNDF